MSDAYPLPKNIPQGPQLDASGVAQQMPDLAKRVSSLTTSPNYQALKGPASFGAAGLPGAAQLAGAIPGVSGLMGGLGGLAATGAASLAAPAALAYGAGKLIAPKWTDETVGKIKDFISSKFAPVIQKAGEIGSAQEVGMAEAIPGSRFIEKNVLPQQVNDYLTQIKNQHPLAVTAGKISGMAGMMAIPGVNAIAGTGIGATLGNAAINAAPYALGTGLDVGATTGDVGKGIGAGLLAEGVGTALPAAVSGLSKIPAVNRFLAKIQMKGAGMRDSDPTAILRARAKSIGLTGGAADTFVTNHMDDLVTNSADLIGKYGGSKAAKEAMHSDLSNAWEAHAKLVDGLTGKQIDASDISAVANDADLTNARAIFGDDKVDQAIQYVGGKINGQGWTRARNQILPAFMKPGNFKNQARFGMAAEDERILQSQVAQAWHDRIDSVADRAMDWAKSGELGPEAEQAALHGMADGGAVPELHTLKAVYPAQLAIGKSGVRESSFMSKIAEEASPTFARQAVGAILHGGLEAGGAAVAGPLGALAANIGGRALGSIGGRMAEKGAGALAGAIRNAGEVPALGKAAILAAPLATQINGPTNPTGETMGGPEQAPAPASPTPAGAAPIPNAPMGQPAPTPVISPQDQAQQDFQQAGQEPAKIGKWNDSAVEARIDEKYSRYVRMGLAGPNGQNVSREQYKQAFINTTHGMDPTLPDTWKAMFDDPATSEKMYNGYMNLQKIDSVQPIRALNYYRRLFHPGERISSEERINETEDNAKLVQALSDMTKQPAKEIDKRLRALSFGKKPEQWKQALSDMMIKEGGIDVPLLVQMGLWGG